MKKHVILLFILLFSASCSSVKTKKYTPLINNVSIKTQGNSSVEREYMQDVCKSFKLTNEKIVTYYLESRLSTEMEVHDSYNILPCYSTGNMTIDGELFTWVIRAGGVANFESKNKSFIRVCDKKCCIKTRDIC